VAVPTTLDTLPIGKAEVRRKGKGIALLAFGALVPAAEQVGAELGLTVVNMRFVKPLDSRLLLERIEAAPWVVTVEENALQTGFGSAVLEAVHDARIGTGPIVRLGLPDRFVEHGERGELLAELGLDATGIAQTCRALAGVMPANGTCP
jgi:1-deoxy-D-xylulose-5-phosphate synthase